MNQPAPHNPVMLNEMLQAMAPKDGEIYVDGTFGAGGYSAALLQAVRCKVYAIDRDPSVRQFAERLQQEFPDSFVLIEGCFSEMVTLLVGQGVSQVDGIVLDLGVSSMQLDQAERGFSFQQDGPLDMRMGSDGIGAAELVNEIEETELADIIYRFGEERHSRRIAKAIVRAREAQPIETTRQLAEIVQSVLGSGRGKAGPHPATRTFQAIRIAVNDELGEIERALEGAERLLKPGGRLVVVSFHSLEDRLVKQFLEMRSGKESSISRHLPMQKEDRPAPTFSLPKGKKLVKVSERETRENPRARSSRLRWAVRTDAPVTERRAVC